MIGMIDKTDNETVLFDDSPLTMRPKTVIGYRRNGTPVYNVAGGAADVVDVDVADSDDDADDDGDDDAGDADADAWTPPSREDYHKLVEAKKKADSEAAARKRFLRDAGFDPKTGQKVVKPSLINADDADDDDDDAADDSTQKDGQKTSPGFNKEKFEKQFQRQLDREVTKAERTGRTTAYSLIHEVPSALEEAGWNGKNLPRMIKLLDLDSVEIDSDGIDADALADQVSELKKDFPEFFKRARMRDAAKDVADTAVAGGGKKQAPASTEDMDWKTRMKMQLLQGNG